MVIYKYALKEDIVKLPEYSKILHVGIQNDDLFVWALVDPAQELVPTFKVVGTGNPCGIVATDTDHMFDYDLGIVVNKFVGTFIMYSGNLILHVFQYTDYE